MPINFRLSLSQMGFVDVSTAGYRSRVKYFYTVSDKPQNGLLSLLRNVQI